MVALYYKGKLVVPDGCPMCGGLLSFELMCQRTSCGLQWESKQHIQDAYRLIEEMKEKRND